MTQEQYKQQISALKEEFERRKAMISREFAFSNNTVQIGDVISDHLTIIKVENITWAYSIGGLPQCVYIGTQLTKSGQPAKRQTDTKIFQSNLK